MNGWFVKIICYDKFTIVYESIRAPIDKRKQFD